MVSFEFQALCKSRSNLADSTNTCKENKKGAIETLLVPEGKLKSSP